jgi:hypothetical protein
MELGYSEVSSDTATEWLPLLQVRLRGPLGLIPLPMLVDSGATETMVPAKLLEALGVPLDGEQVVLTGANGAEFPGRAAQVRIEFGLHALVSRVVAYPDAVKGMPLLGHRDFFLNFWVGFDSRGRKFYVSPHRTR